MIRKSLLFFFIILCQESLQAIEIIELLSPDEKTKIEVSLTEKIYYSVYRNEEMILYSSPLSMKIRGTGNIGYKPLLVRKSNTSFDEVINTVWGNNRLIRNQYNELILDFAGNYSVIFRAYNDGVAYRFKTNFKTNIIVEGEEVLYRLLNDCMSWTYEYGSMSGSSEALFVHKKISELDSKLYTYTPIFLELPTKQKIVLCESDIWEYPGMYLQHVDQTARFELRGIFARYPTQFADGGWCQFDRSVSATADYIANTNGSREFPWRAMIIADNDLEVLKSDMVYKLSRPQVLDDISWIKPGKVCWDWWSDWNIENVNFKTGLNTQTYKYYIDYAAVNKIEYVLLDEGWSDPHDMLLPKPGMDIPQIVNYASSKGVKIILWCLWKTAIDQKDQVFPLFQKMGISGIKVDFIDRDDQLAITSTEMLAREAAKYKLLVDFHGCAKPTGLSRMYPNVINYEGVRGNEYNKFGNEGPEPLGNTVLPFTRLMAGPMDFTPGGMRNCLKNNFCVNNSNPGVYGTRCHQLGMFVVFAAPFQMLCDAPTEYLKYPDILKFISEIPSTWDVSLPLLAKIGEYVVIARSMENNWYIGGLNNWDERKITLDLSFMEEGDYNLEIFKDGINANRLATDYQVERKTVSNDNKLEISMAGGGGFLLKLTKVE